MLRALHTAATGMTAQQTNIDVIANNLANVNTTGFRKHRAEFQDLVYHTVRTPGGRNAQGNTLPVGLQIGQGVRTTSTEHLHSQGSLLNTENPLDLAIEGDGFFQIAQADGQPAYTRSGNFKVDSQGQLTTVDGQLLEPSILIPTDAVSITVSQDGTVSVQQAGQPNAQEVGQIQLAKFANPGGLQAMGHSLFRQSDASGQPIVSPPGTEGIGMIQQGFLEGSNVQVVTEMIDLIASQRAYEISNRVIRAADEMLQRASER